MEMDFTLVRWETPISNEKIIILVDLMFPTETGLKIRCETNFDEPQRNFIIESKTELFRVFPERYGSILWKIVHEKAIGPTFIIENSYWKRELMNEGSFFYEMKDAKHYVIGASDYFIEIISKTEPEITFN